MDRHAGLTTSYAGGERFKLITLLSFSTFVSLLLTSFLIVYCTLLIEAAKHAVAVCPGTQVALNCTSAANNFEGSRRNLWKLPVGTCPDKNDSIQLPQGAGQGCGGMVTNCGPLFRACNVAPDPLSGMCLTSVLTFVANGTITILCGSSDQSDEIAISTAGTYTVHNSLQGKTSRHFFMEGGGGGEGENGGGKILQVIEKNCIDKTHVVVHVVAVKEKNQIRGGWGTILTPLNLILDHMLRMVCQW